MNTALAVERDTEILIDTTLKNLGWCLEPQSEKRNVYLQRVKTEEQKKKLEGKRPDYVLYQTDTAQPVAIIEAKKPGQNIQEAIAQGAFYAEKIDAPIVFATDGIFTKSLHLKSQKPLTLNGEEVDTLLKESLLLKYIETSDINTLDKKVVKSRGDLLSIFEVVNDILREEGIQKGLDRFTEFSNILFLKVLSEIEDIREMNGEKSNIDAAYRWNAFKDKKGKELLSYVSDTVLKWFAKEYKDEEIFQDMQIRHPDNLKAIINLLDELQLTDINADIKGDAFEYFLRSYSASNPSDLGEIFTPRHIVKTVVKFVNPQIGEKVYDPFCGTGGMLTVAYKHLMDTMPRNERNIQTLKEDTIYGADITKTANIAKMNMILAGDGHSNIVRQDSLAHPCDDQYDIVITNMPFAQKTRYGDKYPVPSRMGDVICIQHCFRAVKKGGRMAIIVPDGFLSNKSNSAFVKTREYLLNHAKLQSVISLPRGAFEPYNRAKASILYFTEVKEGKTDSSYWYYDVRNDGYTLDKRRTYIEGTNDLEIVLSERNLDILAEDYIHKMGMDKIPVEKVRDNHYVLNAVSYRDYLWNQELTCGTLKIGDILEEAPVCRVGSQTDIPIMSITMEKGLIDQSEKFKKRIASKDISKYKKVKKDELVVGFPIDEGVLGFQRSYPEAAVSPAYAVWRLKEKENKDLDLDYIEIVLRSSGMREVYKRTMQGAVDRRRAIPADVFIQILIPYPSVDVRKEIVKKSKEIEKARKLIRLREKEIDESIIGFWK